MATARVNHISAREDHARGELGIEGGMAIGVVERRERRQRRQSCSVLEQRKGGGGKNSKQVLGRVWREAVSRGARRASRRGRPSLSLGCGDKG
jgi:hypothetical protein